MCRLPCCLVLPLLPALLQLACLALALLTALQLATATPPQHRVTLPPSTQTCPALPACLARPLDTPYRAGSLCQVLQIISYLIHFYCNTLLLC